MKKYCTLVLIVGLVFVIQGCSKKAKQEPMAESDEIISDIEGTAATAQAAPAAAVGAQNQHPSAVTLSPTGKDIAAPTYTAAAVQPVVPVADASMAAGTETYEKPTTQSIQEALKNAGVYSGTVDGVLGPNTKKAVREFQTMNNLSADGKVGRKTWLKLKPYLSGVPAAPSPAATGVSN